MNKALRRLFEIANKTEYRIIGLMSGTSLDGLDIALCRVTKDEVVQEQFKSIQYPEIIKQKLLETRSKELVSLSDISFLNTNMAHFFADEVLIALQDWRVGKQDVDLISSHGQTVYHAPEAIQEHTFQIVDGDHIAQKTGVITISDFRQKHVAAGGEGAPIAKYLDEFLFKDEHKIRVALNLGGIANLTVLYPKTDARGSISSDIGPANTLINDAMFEFFNLPYDDGGQLARQGNSHSELVKYLLLDPFFRKPFPKTTGQELFNLEWVKGLMESHSIELSPVDLVSTLTELSVKSVSRAIDELIEEHEFDLIISGGGRKNKTLIEGLKRDLPNARLMKIEDFGISSDAKEAVLIAYLGFRLLSDKGMTVNGAAVHLGKISLPH